MARKRLISPQFFTHAELYDAEAKSGLPLRIAFAGLWCQADRRGIFAWRPRELKLAILPYDPSDFGAVLAALETDGFVRRYDVAGQAFGIIPSFSRWQSFHLRELASDAPEPPRDVTSMVPTPGKHDASTPVAVTGTGTDAVRTSGDPPEGELRPHSRVDNRSAPPAADAARNGNGHSGTAPLPSHARKLLRSCYGSAPEQRQADVQRQLAATLGKGAVFEKDQRVKAVDVDHLDDACRRVLADPPRKPDAAIRFVLIKLRDSFGETRAAREKADHPAEPPRHRTANSGPMRLGEAMRAAG